MQWRGDWSSASVVNHTIVTDPTIRQPGFDLPRHTWSLLNPCHANLHKWGLAQSPWTTLSTRAHQQNLKADWIYSGNWMTTQSYSWNLQRFQHSRNNNNSEDWTHSVYGAVPLDPFSRQVFTVVWNAVAVIAGLDVCYFWREINDEIAWAGFQGYASPGSAIWSLCLLLRPVSNFKSLDWDLINMQNVK